jgi:hypothetical protein
VSPFIHAAQIFSCSYLHAACLSRVSTLGGRIGAAVRRRSRKQETGQASRRSHGLPGERPLSVGARDDHRERAVAQTMAEQARDGGIHSQPGRTAGVARLDHRPTCCKLVHHAAGYTTVAQHSPPVPGITLQCCCFMSAPCESARRSTLQCSSVTRSAVLRALSQGVLMKQQQQLRDLMADLDFSSPSVQALQVRSAALPRPSDAPCNIQPIDWLHGRSCFGASLVAMRLVRLCPRPMSAHWDRTMGRLTESWSCSTYPSTTSGTRPSHTHTRARAHTPASALSGRQTSVPTPMPSPLRSLRSMFDRAASLRLTKNHAQHVL